jgi:hypothetical protein
MKIGQDTYPENRLPLWQNAPRKVSGQNVMKNKKAEPSLFENMLLWVHFITEVSWLFLNLYLKRTLLIPIMTIFNEREILGLLGLGLKIVVFSKKVAWQIFIKFLNWTT